MLRRPSASVGRGQCVQRNQRISCHRSRRHHSYSLSASRDGAGRDYRAADDCCRRARMRLVESEGRTRFAGQKLEGKERLRLDDHRRQPRRTDVVANAVAGRRECARPVDCRRGPALERAGERMRGGQQQGYCTSRPDAASTMARSPRMPPRSSSTRSRQSGRRISSNSSASLSPAWTRR